MNPDSFDEELAAYFRAEREADESAAPPFEALLPGPARRPRRSLWMGGAGVLLAASIAGVLMQSVQQPRGVATGGSVDAACDAALAALLEQESDARMELPTDALFHN